MNEEKSLVEFLVDLHHATLYNIQYSDWQFPSPNMPVKYIKELQMVHDLINSFDFVRKE